MKYSKSIATILLAFSLLWIAFLISLLSDAIADNPGMFYLLVVYIMAGLAGSVLLYFQFFGLGYFFATLFSIPLIPAAVISAIFTIGIDDWGGDLIFLGSLLMMGLGGFVLIVSATRCVKLFIQFYRAKD